MCSLVGGRVTRMDETTKLASLVFRLNQSKLASLKDLTRATRVRQSEYLREAITDLLEKYESELLD